MVKDKRAKTVKLLIEAKKINSLAEIFDVIPVSIVATKALGTNYDRLTDRISNPGKFRMSEVVLLASYFEVDERVMIEIVYGQVVANRNKRKRK
jgi:hypothetical protein